MSEINDFGAAFAQLKSRDPVYITYHEQKVALTKVLGKGGSKSVYDANCNGEVFALGLPNTVDHTTRAAMKWEATLREPEATNIIRALGLLVNARCEVMPVLVNEHPLEAIRMTRYADMPLQVRDSKNPISSVVEGNAFGSHLDRGTFLDATEGLRHDIVTLLQNDIGIGSDSFNMCLADGQPRLYLNDLGSAEFGAINPDNRADYAKYYARHAIEAVLNGVSSDEFDRHMQFFQGVDFGFREEGNFYDEWARLVA